MAKRKKKKKEVSFKEVLTSTKSLTIIFIGLCVFVFVLGGFLVSRKMNQKPEANMLIAVMEKEKSYSFHINAYALKDEDSYLLKVVNYRGDSIINEDITYSMTITNPTDSEISIKKLDNFEEVGDELMVDPKESKIVDEKFNKNEKNENWYKISMTKKGNLKENELIRVLIES